MMTQLPDEPNVEADGDVGAKNARLGKIFIGVVVAMFVAGFASIPLYRIVCAKVDPGGSSWFNGEPDVYEDVTVDEDRQIRVRFNTNVERQLPWEFDVEERHVDINPGEKRVVQFSAVNPASDSITGKAVYDISPPEAAPYFKKVECFCFIEQTIDGGETIEFPLVFWFEPDLPEHITQISVGYTFFNAESSRTRAAIEN